MLEDEFTIEDIKEIAKERAKDNALKNCEFTKDDIEASAKELFSTTENAKIYFETYQEAYVVEKNNIIKQIKNLARNYAKELAKEAGALDLTKVPQTLGEQFQPYLELYVKEVELACEKEDVLKIVPQEAEPEDKEESSEDAFSEIENESEAAKNNRIKNIARSKATTAISKGQTFNEKRLDRQAKKQFKNEQDAALYKKHYIEIFTTKRANQPIEDKIKAAARSRATQNLRHGSNFNLKALTESTYKQYPNSTHAQLYIKEYEKVFKEKEIQTSRTTQIKALARSRAQNRAPRDFELKKDELEKRAKNEFPDADEAEIYIQEFTKTFEELLERIPLTERVKNRAKKDAIDAYSNGVKLDKKRLSKTSEKYKEHTSLYFDTYLSVWEEKQRSVEENSSEKEEGDDKSNSKLREEAYRTARRHNNRTTPFDFEKFCQKVQQDYGANAKNFMKMYHEYKAKLAPKSDKDKVTLLAKNQGKNAAWNAKEFDSEELSKKGDAHGEHKQHFIDEYTKSYNHHLTLKLKSYLEEDVDEDEKLTEEQARIKFFAITRASHDARIGIKLKVPILKERALKEFGKQYVQFYVDIFESTFNNKDKPKSLQNQVKSLAQRRAWELAQRGEEYDEKVLEEQAKAQGDLAQVYKDRFIETYQNKMKQFEKEGVDTKAKVDPKTKEKTKDASFVKKIAENLAMRAAKEATGVSDEALVKASEEYGKHKKLYIETYKEVYKAKAATGLDNLKKHAFTKGLEYGRKWGTYSELVNELVNIDAKKHFHLADEYKAAFKRGFDISAKAKNAKKSKESVELPLATPTLLFQATAVTSTPRAASPQSVSDDRERNSPVAR